VEDELYPLKAEYAGMTPRRHPVKRAMDITLLPEQKKYKKSIRTIAAP